MVKLDQKSQKISDPLTRTLRVTHGLLPQAASHPAWGVDPGVNFGLTVIENEKVYVFHGSLIQDDKPGRYGLLAYQFLRNMMSKFYHRKAALVIEGASYGDQYGQVGLAVVRTGFYLAAALDHHTFADVQIKPPKTIRKAVFGDGTIKAPDEWPTLNRNAADSLAIALYAATLE
jgi:hypothetical protein